MTASNWLMSDWYLARGNQDTAGDGAGHDDGEESDTSCYKSRDILGTLKCKKGLQKSPFDLCNLFLHGM